MAGFPGISPSIPTTRDAVDVDLCALYDQYASAVFNFGLRNLGDREDAADVLQETFLNAWLSVKRGVAPEAPHAWLLAIARNLCVSRHRARAARVQTTCLDKAHDLTARQPVEESIELGQMLRRLPKQQRRAFVLYEVRGLSHREVAAELGLSCSAVTMLVFRARRALAKSLVETDAFEHGSAQNRTMLLGMLKAFFGWGATLKVATVVSIAPLALLPFSGASNPRVQSSRPLKVGHACSVSLVVA